MVSGQIQALGLYARCSTLDQHAEAQLHALRSYAAARGFEAVEFVDQGVIGAKDRRPALDALLADVRRQRFSSIVVVKLDRLARSVRHLTALAGDLWSLLASDWWSSIRRSIPPPPADGSSSTCSDRSQSSNAT